MVEPRDLYIHRTTVNIVYSIGPLLIRNSKSFPDWTSYLRIGAFDTNFSITNLESFVFLSISSLLFLALASLRVLLMYNSMSNVHLTRGWGYELVQAEFN